MEKPKTHFQYPKIIIFIWNFFPDSKNDQKIIKSSSEISHIVPLWLDPSVPFFEAIELGDEAAAEFADMAAEDFSALAS